jgi:hypothetical protein
MVLFLLARVKVVYFVIVKVDQFPSKWSLFLIDSFWRGSFCWLSKTLAAALHVHHNLFDDLANDLFAIGCGGGWDGPECGNIGRQMANGLSLGFASSRRGLCWTKR